MSADRTQPPEVAIVFSGGGARAAYQVGLLRCIARLMPEYRFAIIVGVSAGAVNASFLGAHPESVGGAAEELYDLWSELSVDDIFHSEGLSLSRTVARWATRLVSGGGKMAPQVRGLVDTEPLDRLLRRELKTVDGEIPGIARNIAAGYLRAVALTTLNYHTGETVTWVEGREIEAWERSNRRSVVARLSVDHVMASAALPLFFPAVRLADGWHGDGGVRLAAPLSPAVHLGARKILAVSTRFRRGPEQVVEVPTSRYPPPAQILGKLMSAIFLDIVDQDAQRLERINSLIRELPPEKRHGMREIECLVLRPSVDLGRLAAEYEPGLPKAFRFLTRSLGTRETSSPDFLSLLMFQADYLKRLMEIGEADAEARRDEIAALLQG